MNIAQESYAPTQHLLLVSDFSGMFCRQRALANDHDRQRLIKAPEDLPGIRGGRVDTGSGPCILATAQSTLPDAFSAILRLCHTHLGAVRRDPKMVALITYYQRDQNGGKSYLLLAVLHPF